MSFLFSIAMVEGAVSGARSWPKLMSKSAQRKEEKAALILLFSLAEAFSSYSLNYLEGCAAEAFACTACAQEGSFYEMEAVLDSGQRPACCHPTRPPSLCRPLRALVLARCYPARLAGGCPTKGRNISR